jgi:hypothetical protein
MTVMIDEAHAHRLERVRYFPRQLIGADDLTQEQCYHRQKLRNHNRFLHGWGVVCGCDVMPANDPTAPWVVRVCPGYILTPQGDEIWIPTDARFDLETCLTESEDPSTLSPPCPPIARPALESKTVHLAVRYVECQARPVRVAPIGCGCDDADCEYSRIQDGYEFACLSELPRTHVRVRVDCEQLCDPDLIMPAPGCPDDPWVVLATVKVPDRGRLVEEITFTNRRALRSTAMLQELAHCLCDRGPRTPTEPTTEPTIELLTVTEAAIVHFEEPGVATSDDIRRPFERPSASLSVEASDRPNGVEVRFNSAVDPRSVTRGTFQVCPVFGTRVSDPVSGTFSWFEDGTVLRFEAAEPFDTGRYEITLISREGGEAIIAAAGEQSPLDGDQDIGRTTWPTGDGAPYGSCVMSFRVLPAEPF